MTEYGPEIDAILAKAGSEWTPDESRKIEALVADGQRSKLKAAMQVVRGGDKPSQVINNQDSVN